MSERTNAVTISTLTLLKAAAIFLFVWFLFAIRDVLLLLVISIIIASAIDPLADFLQRKKSPAVLVFYLSTQYL